MKTYYTRPITRKQVNVCWPEKGQKIQQKKAPQSHFYDFVPRQYYDKRLSVAWSTLVEEMMTENFSRQSKSCVLFSYLLLTFLSIHSGLFLYNCLLNFQASRSLYVNVFSSCFCSKERMFTNPQKTKKGLWK